MSTVFCLIQLKYYLTNIALPKIRVSTMLGLFIRKREKGLKLVFFVRFGVFVLKDPWRIIVKQGHAIYWGYLQLAIDSWHFSRRLLEFSCLACWSSGHCHSTVLIYSCIYRTWVIFIFINQYSKKVQIWSEAVIKCQAYVAECLMILMFGLREVFKGRIQINIKGKLLNREVCGTSYLLELYIYWDTTLRAEKEKN